MYLCCSRLYKVGCISNVLFFPWRARGTIAPKPVVNCIQVIRQSMDSLPFNFNNNKMEETKPIFTTDSETATTNTESFAAPSSRNLSGGAQEFFPGNGLLNLRTQQEPRVADTAPTAPDMDEVMMNFRMNGTDMMFDDVDHNSNNYYNMGAGSSRTESTASGNMWHGAGAPASGKTEMMDTFEFLIKSLSSANNYVSMLTREQLSLLRCIRPSLLYEFLQEVLKARTERRSRRGLPNECAFCKNNGENEECYASHALKDWRGRVLCPVLRAFRCPRCGATGDRAHTIKYCQEPGDTDRNGGLSSRRRGPPSVSLLNNGAPAPASCPPTPAPAPSPSAAGFNAPWWTSYGFN